MGEVNKPRRADAVRNRARIVAAAEQLLASRGIAVSVDEIAREAGVGVGTLYRHFPTKEDLFEAILLQRLERLVTQAEAYAGSDDPGAGFFDFLSGWIGAAAASRDLADGMAQAGYDAHAMTAGIKQRLYDALEVLLERAQAGGAARDDIGIDDLRVLLNGACMGVRDAEDERRARVIEVWCDGLRPVPKRATRAPARARR